MNITARLLIPATLGIFGSAAAWSYPNGPPAARTMAPGDRPGQACTVCHGGAANPVNSFGGNVRITFPNGLTYTAGQAQDLTVTVSDSSAATFGFELTARSDSAPSSTPAGTFTAGADQRVICSDGQVAPSGGCTAGTGLSWIEHTAPSMTGVWTVHWSPPASASGPVHFFIAANGSNGDNRPTGDHIYATDYVVLPASTATTGIPVISSIEGSAGATGSIQSCSWVTVRGLNFGAAAGTDWTKSISSDNVFPTTLGSVTVMIDGKPAPISFVNNNQINAIVPQDTTVGNVQVIVSNAVGSSAAKTVQMTADAPGFFTVDGRHVAGVVLDSGGGSTLLAPAGSISGATSRAAKAGETVTLFGSGFGRTQAPVNPNLAQSFAVPLAHTTGDFRSAQATLTIGGQPATISFIGTVSPGLYQINASVPQGLSPGDQPVVLSLLGGDSTGKQFVTIPIQ